jgi:putative transport protein
MFAVVWLSNLLERGSIPWGLATLSLACTLGLMLGAIRVYGFRLGVAGVLFSALVFGQIGLTVNPAVLEFLRDFALILFVYAIGLQVGPGFVTSLKEEGLQLNVFAILVVVLGAALTCGLCLLLHLKSDAATGLYTGAFTTTPGLGAGQEALAHLLPENPARMQSAVAMAGLAYTVTYPFGLVGPILTIVLLKNVFRVQVEKEAEELAAAEQVRRPTYEVVDFEVIHPEHAGKKLKDHELLRSKGIYFVRQLRNGVLSVPTADTSIQVGDHYRAIGPSAALPELVRIMGRPSTVELTRGAGDVRRMELIVTRTSVLRQPLSKLDLIRRTGVTLARINRAGIDLPARAALRLQFGDRVTAIGPEHGLKAVEQLLGNSPDLLNRSQLIPIFLGIVLGVMVGSVPLWVPGMQTRLRIGLAGGPMIVAIILSQLGNIGSVVWYMPAAANQLFRDFGLAVFLACVGLQSGDHFIQRVSQSGGVLFILWGALITVLPLALIAFIARARFKMNFITLSGLMAGAMTSTPALVFANELAGSDAPSVAYAAVAPLAMLVPIICAQLLAVLM